MRKWIAAVCVLILAVSLAACGTSEKAASDVKNTETKALTAKETSRQISIKAENGDTVIFQLNSSAAAEDLYGQLPLSVETEDFSTNEKIFYPPGKLDTDNAPAAEAGAGTLAYYAPWGDVVMFYDDFESNGELFELGQAVSGAEQIKDLSGEIRIEKLGK